MADDPKSAWKTFSDEIEVAGHQLVEQVTRLLAEGNVRRLLIRSESGEVFLSVPLTAGAVVGGVAALAAPWLAVIAAVAGLVAKVRIEVVRQDPGPGDAPQDDGGGTGPDQA